MNEIEKGLFVMEEDMPCSPKRIRLGYYSLSHTLGRMETEEAAARIISFSHQLDQWVGVSWPRIVEMMKEDYEKSKAFDQELDRQFKRMDAWFAQLNRHFWFCVLTVGLYGLFAKKPKKPDASEEFPEMPMSGIYNFGPEHVVTGIKELLAQNMLEKRTEGEGDSAQDVLFPTPALISCIMEAQDITA